MAGKGKTGRVLYYTDDVLSDLAKSLYKWVDDNSEKGKFALLGDWCFQNKFNPKYFKRYADKHPEFKEAHSWARAWQEHMVAKGALNQSLNARFAQFFLGCCHDWRTKDNSDEKLTSLKNEFGKFLDEVKGKDSSECEEDAE